MVKLFLKIILVILLKSCVHKCLPMRVTWFWSLLCVFWTG